MAKLGTDRLAANRFSEQTDRLIRAFITTFVQFLGVMLVGGVFGALLLVLYRGLDSGEYWARVIGGLVAVFVWITVAREEARTQRRKAVQHEQRRRADTAGEGDRTARLEGHGDAGQAPPQW
jgi:hypothetical protein